MKIPYSKSSFHKLYLIEKEMYDRILPYLNEVDKQEIDDLNKEHRPELDESDQLVEAEVEDDLTPNGNVEGEDNESEADRDIISQRHVYRENLQEVLPPEINEEDFSLRKNKTKLKRPKKYSCELCVNKKFTTKSSLNRHHQTFHVLRQPINKVDYVQTNPKEETSKANNLNSIIQIKRQREEEDDDITYPDGKIKRYGDLDHGLEYFPMKKGLKRKGPKRATDLEPRKKIHLDNPDDEVTKYDPDIDDEVEHDQVKRGIKRKGPKRATDLEPRKKFHWETY